MHQCVSTRMVKQACPPQSLRIHNTVYSNSTVISVALNLRSKEASACLPIFITCQLGVKLLKNILDRFLILIM